MTTENDQPENPDESDVGISIVLPQGMMGAGKDYLVDAIVRAIAESHATENEWAEKYGINFDNDVFSMHRYCWCEQEDCPWCGDSEDGIGAPNFHFKPTGFKLWWYKYIGRGMEMNRQVSIEECSRMLAECIKK